MAPRGAGAGGGLRELFRGAVQAARDLSRARLPRDLLPGLAVDARGRCRSGCRNARLGQPFAALLYTQVFYAPRVLTGLLFGHVLGPNVMHLFHAGVGLHGPVVRGAAPRARRARRPSSRRRRSRSLRSSSSSRRTSRSPRRRRGRAGRCGPRRGCAARPSLRSTAWLAGVARRAFHAGSPEMWLWQALLAGFVLLRSRRVDRLGRPGVRLGGALARWSRCRPSS